MSCTVRHRMPLTFAQWLPRRACIPNLMHMNKSRFSLVKWNSTCQMYFSMLEPALSKALRLTVAFLSEYEPCNSEDESGGCSRYGREHYLALAARRLTARSGQAKGGRMPEKMGVHIMLGMRSTSHTAAPQFSVRWYSQVVGLMEPRQRFRITSSWSSAAARRVKGGPRARGSGSIPHDSRELYIS